MSAGAQYFFAVGGAPFVIGEESSYLRSFSVKVSYAWGKRSHEDDIIIDFGSYAGSVAGPRNTAEAVEHLTKQLAKKA